MASSKAEGRVLLPPSVEPINYDLTIIPNFTNFTYTGTVSIVAS